MLNGKEKRIEIRVSDLQKKEIELYAKICGFSSVTQYLISLHDHTVSVISRELI